MTICYRCLMVFCFAFCSFLNICPLFVSFNLFCFRLIGRYVYIVVLNIRNGRKIKENALTKACLCLFVKSIVFFCLLLCLFSCQRNQFRIDIFLLYNLEGRVCLYIIGVFFFFAEPVVLFTSGGAYGPFGRVLS